MQLNPNKRLPLTKEAIIQRLKANHVDIDDHGVRSIGIFGPHATGDQTITSTINILVDIIASEATYENFFSLKSFLDSLFPVHQVEVITKGSLSNADAPDILDEVIYV